MAYVNLSIIIIFFFFFGLISFMGLCGRASSSSGNGGFRIPMLRSHPPPPSPSNEQGRADTSKYWNSVLRRSTLRYNSLQRALAGAEPTQDDMQGDGEYVMELNIGTPPQTVRAVVDCASDSIWVQCLPYERCGTPPPSRSVYSPSNSSTFTVVPCNTTECTYLDQYVCGSMGQCSFTGCYDDGRQRSGVLAHDTFAFPTVVGGNGSFGKIAYDCTTDDAFISGSTSARVGLAGGVFSLVSQLGQRVNWRFSYCLSPGWSRRGSGVSQLRFGDEAVLVGDSTPLTEVQERPYRVFYMPALEDISVGNERVGIPAGTFDRQRNGTGGVILDAGTPLMHLTRDAFDMVARKVRVLGKLEEKLAPAPPGGRWGGCFEGTEIDLRELMMPYVTLHFAGGLNVALHPLNLLAEVDSSTVCLLMVPTNGVSIIGTHAQMNVNVGYDLRNGVLTMSPTFCTA